ncbi:hypothetical protein BK816_00325 [Boudabousia tangfeifanii]|uniref:AB hydrolase-1 domain-containing protein n=1 Tax=Boudabousia tangfeifanii TaxID=1912795 RepID=A0A1D9MHZ2_9ACTO|nr:alpha/beta fold hydrolase [Boudabousia tangfeifanii]AOZ71925.1 hypothetical protein BK816_00325 [Boudabousia tangfeifanii]
METNTWKNGDFTYRDHVLNLPWDHQNPDNGLGTLEVFAREVVRDGGEKLPYLVFFQGGPGCASPRPINPEGGWLGRLLKDYRVLLLDQRGTGASTPLAAPQINALGNIEQQLQYLRLLRTDQIVADAEAFRAELCPDEKWTLFGQSYGGFCITTYLSYYPQAIERVLLTGGTPALDTSADDIYRLTYDKLRFRHEQFNRRFPETEAMIRRVCAHLEDHEELLPTGERLSARRLRTVGINLGRDTGFMHLRLMFENPFTTLGGTTRLRPDFLAQVGGEVSMARTPLYALMHETIYAGATPALEGQATNWAAHRISREVAGFAEDANPLAKDEPFFLTGEHIYPWMFEEDPALTPLAEVANALAQYTNWPPLYLPQQLAANQIPGAAAIYFDDIFVPVEPSLKWVKTAGIERYVTSKYQHSGIGTAGAEILGQLLELSR